MEKPLAGIARSQQKSLGLLQDRAMVPSDAQAKILFRSAQWIFVGCCDSWRGILEFSERP
jgi:hypothetical protein